MLVLAGSGTERERLESLAAGLGVRLVVLPDVPWERIVERFVLADVFALLSRHEPWGVVVNEAAACGLPLVVSDRVGAAFDLRRGRAERRARALPTTPWRQALRSARSPPTRSAAARRARPRAS